MKIILSLTLIILASSAFGDPEVCEKVDDKDVQVCYKSGVLTRAITNTSDPLFMVHVHLDAENITTIGANAFSGLSITGLKFTGPSRSEIPKTLSLFPDSFAGIPELDSLYLYDVSINFNNGNPLTGLRSLQSLIIISSNLTEVPTEMLKSVPELTGLSLITNQIRVIRSNSFSSVKRLESLDLDGNGVTNIEAGAFDGLSELTFLQLSDNAFPTSAVLFQGLRNLRILRLRQAFDPSQSQLHVGMFDDLPLLSRLYMPDNHIKNIPKGVFEDLTSLKMLDLSSNKIAMISPGGFGRVSLDELRLWNNRVQAIETDTFHGLTVRRLHLQENVIGELKSRAFGGLTVRELNLGGNNLTVIGADDFEGAKIDGLRLNKNAIGGIAHGAFKDVVSRSLDISDNPVGATEMSRDEWGLGNTVWITYSKGY